MGKNREINKADYLFFWSLRGIGVLTMILLCSIVLMLFLNSRPALEHIGLSFFWTDYWDPVSEEFGVLSFMYGTLVTSLLGIFIATPLSIGVALFLTEMAQGISGRVIGFLVEMLAAIPSVVYGLWGIFVLAPWLREKVEPWLQSHFGFLPLFQGPPLGVGILCAGIILAIMITPTISAICREVFSNIPKQQKEAALALGSTRWEMIRLAVLKTGKTGILGAVILGLGRALGETMAVTMVVGNRPQISASLFAPAQTMASVIANEYAEATSDIHLSTLALVGLSLFLVSLVINAVAKLMVLNLNLKRKHL